MLNNYQSYWTLWQSRMHWKYFNISSFLLIWDKNFGSYTSWLVPKPLWMRWWTGISIERDQDPTIMNETVVGKLAEKFFKLKSNTLWKIRMILWVLYHWSQVTYRPAETGLQSSENKLLVSMMLLFCQAN